MDKKIKVLLVADHMFSTSGVGHVARVISEALLTTEKFQIRQLAGAIKHNDYKPLKTDRFGDDLMIYPVDGYGNPEIIRSVIRTEKPDIFLFISDPRFYVWLWQLEDEIRPLMPMVYYHVWDNYPYPTFNRPYYLSNDYIACISSLTHDIVKTVAPEIPSMWLPHSVDSNNIFKPIPEEFVTQFKIDTFKAGDKLLDTNRTVFFFNSRNARRKQTGTMIWWFNDFLNKVGRDAATLIMHTDPKDENGQDLEAIVRELNLTQGQVLFSREKISQEGLALIYNMADCTINISDAEGWGLSATESLSCGTPVICTYTGGLKDQITDGTQEFGVAIKPSSSVVIGSQDIPWIYEDRIGHDDFVNALLKIHNMTREERKLIGAAGRKFVVENYDFKKFGQSWVDLLLSVHDKCGSWDTRRGYKSWEIKAL